MEMNQIICDNLGMTRDMSISSLSKEKDGSANYAFENHNIRVLAVNDNTKFSVTNEKSTKYETSIKGVFIGGCTCGNYLVVFMQDPSLVASNRYRADFIYRINYTGSEINIVTLYNGNLGFDLEHPIEAIGYYESEEVQKVYWVDGLNQNRFINIVKFSDFDNTDEDIEKKYFFHVWISNNLEQLYYNHSKNKSLTGGDLYALCRKDTTVIGYAEALVEGANVWIPSEIEGVTSISNLPVASHSIERRTLQYNDYSFDFQGRINYIPKVLQLEKNYSKAGTFQAGVIQYFFTYYNKYGVETCIVWNSDLQYLSESSRGGKADEAITCGFDFKITNLEEQYDYLRIYAAYRSGLNGTVSTRIVTEISLDKVSHDSVIEFTDLGAAGINFNSEDLPYIGGQDIRANTLDYKQDTLFLGDITVSSSYDKNIKNSLEAARHDVDIASIGDFEVPESDPDFPHLYIKEGQYLGEPFLTWSYKYVSPIIKEGLYSYTPEIRKSQKDVAGFKYRELYRFGIQFMDTEGTWSPAYWLGDKYCDCPPRTFTARDLVIETRKNTIHFDPNHVGNFTSQVQAPFVNQLANQGMAIRSNSLRGVSTDDPGVEYIETKIVDKYGLDSFGHYQKEEKYDSNGVLIPEEDASSYQGDYTTKMLHFNYEGEGYYMATIMLNINAVKSACTGIDFSKYTAYRLLVVDTDITNRRVVEQGVINPTMFNYVDRYYNRPFAIPSWIFRPRLSAIVNRHYDTLPVQSADNAELQGIISKQLPGYAGAKGNKMNSYMFIVAANRGAGEKGFIQWKLIYYNSGNTDMERAERTYLAMYTGRVEDPQEPQGYHIINRNNNTAESNEIEKVTELIYKYNLPLKDPAYEDLPGEGIFTYTNLQEEAAKNAIKGKLEQGYTPIYIYKRSNVEDSYYIVSSRIFDNNRNWAGITETSKWTTLRSELIKGVDADMQATVATQVGSEIAGKIVLPPGSLPSDALIKEIASAGSNATEIGLAIMAAIVAAAAVVISCLSFGTLTAPMAMAASAAISLAVSVCAAGAVGAASAAATKGLERVSANSLPRKMLALGYYPVGPNDSTNLNTRKRRSRYIGALLEKNFEPVTYIANSTLAGFQWNVPVLQGEAYSNGVVNFKDATGNVPFTTGHPYTEQGYLGEDYNAFVSSGQLSVLSEQEDDLNSKQNLFCVDESIVTLNAPDIEDNVSMIDGAESLRLDLIGVIPIEATYGMYNLVTENGLNSNSQVLQGRFNTNKIGESPLNALGMLNGYLYQDWGPDEAVAFGDNPVVDEKTKVYRQFMWGRNIAGFWFPGVTPKSGIDGETHIVGPTSKISNKIFANMRFSTASLYFPAKKMNIESPSVCLDAEAMLKTFPYNSDIKNYYENVDTISVNTALYPLLSNGANYPESSTNLSKGDLKDPVHIRYKETPHVVIPLSWDDDKNAAVILPYTNAESEISPVDFYAPKDLGDAKLYGIYDNARPIREYVYTTTNPQPSTDTSIVYLYKTGGKYYCIYYDGNAWVTGTAARVYTLPQNSRILITESGVEKDYYLTEGDMDDNGNITLKDDIMDNLSDKPIVGTWLQDLLPWRYQGDTPYLFLGELIKRGFDYGTWNGGVEEQAMEQLVWNVASHVTPIDEHIKESWGDTYYQRWDCEKTYPFTEQDTNSNVEILSFMLESHSNLDGRCDTNRGIHNILNTRPSNTIFNNVYSQKDSFFTYQVLDEKFSKSHFEADVVWSLTKNNMDDIDKWTCLLSSNEMSLDGRYGTVRKVLNVNDVLITFQDTGIAQIKYNETAALNTTSGLPLQMGNTGKVDGYRMISDTIGCHNKFSISKNSAGVFFADDFGKSFNQFTTNGGISDIGMRANFSNWFKKNLNGHLWKANTRDNFRVSYDEITHDLYIVRKDVCVIYNTLLQKFTSFMDYIDTPIITRLISNQGDTDTFALRSVPQNGESYDATGQIITRATSSIVEIWKMFAGGSPVYSSTGDLIGGAYGFIYGAFRPYSMEYRLNPDPMHDSIFTNYQFAADWVDPTKDVEEDNIFDSSARRYTSFDTVEAKNEYQQGIMSVLPRVNGYNRAMGRQPLKSMFRLWRGDIPRNGDTLTGHTPLSDRMRNPWIHLKFTKTSSDDSKMIFHNLMVNYYNQYGRF